MRGLEFCFLILSLGIPLAAQNVSTYSRSNVPEARIEVVASKPASFHVPRTIYGTFLEDIGASIFGGVSAELIDNPSLESYDASLAILEERFSSPDFRHSSDIGLPLPWLPLWEKEGRRYEPRWGHAANSSRYLYLMGLAGQEVGIRQSVYLPIEREQDYDGVLFAASEEGPQTLEVSFRRHDHPEATLARSQVEVPGAPGWHKLAFRLALPPNAVAPLEPVDFAVSIHGDHRLSIDEIRLYPADAVDGLDPEIIRAAKALHSPLLRYGGNFTSSYHWEDGIGPVDLRRTMVNEAWGIPQYNLFGTDELMKFCELTGAHAQICLNLGSGTVEEAHQWVQYCTGAQDTPEGKLRAQNGHPAPYHVAAWEFGNELWNQDDVGWQTPEGNAERYGQFYDALKSVIPPDALIFATGADIDFYREWNAALINQDGPKLKYLTTHFVVGMDRVVDKAAGRDFVWKADLAVPVGVGRALALLRAQINSNPVTRDRVKLAYTEWLFAAPRHSLYPRWSNLGGALVAAGWMNMLLEHADFVPVSDMTGLVEFAGIHKRRGRVFVTPQYWTFWLYSHFAGDTPVSTHTTVREYDIERGVSRVPNIPGVPWLDVLATKDSHRHDLALFVVNRSWKQAIPATINLRDFNPAEEAIVQTLTADSLLAQNDEIHPDRVQPRKTALRLSGEELHYAFPPRSLSVLIIQQK